MVSQSPIRSDVGPGMVASDRGFVYETISAAVESDLRTGRIEYVQPFWRSVIAGSLFVLSLFAVSIFLMFGCGVGLDRNGYLALGAGTAVWMCVTSCIAFYLGGFLSSTLSRPRYRGWAVGAAIWSLSIPLALLIVALASGNNLLIPGINMVHSNTSAVIVESVNSTMNTTGAHFYGYCWTGFIALGLGIIAAMLGGSTAPMARNEKEIVAR